MKPEPVTNPAFDAALARFYAAHERRVKARRLPYPKDDDAEPEEKPATEPTGKAHEDRRT